MNAYLLAAGQGGRFANSAVLLLLGLFTLFLSYAVSQRASMPVDVHEESTDTDVVVDPRREWVQGERTRARLAITLRPVLLATGVVLLIASGIAALVSWS